MGNRVAIHPGALVIADSVDDERVAFPASRRVAVVGRCEIRGRRMRAPAYIDYAKRVRSSNMEDIDALIVRHLDYFDAIIFYGQGDLPMTEEQKAAVMSFVREDGKGVLAAHSGTDSFRASWPEYVEMVGGAFNHHPWHTKVRVLVDDREFPATRHFPPSFEITDEIYQLNRYSRDKVRVLMRLDIGSVDMKAKNVERTDGDYAVTWARDWGKGRVFTSILGHRPEVWDRADIQKMWLDGIYWVLGLTEGETKPLPLPSD